MTSRLPLTQRKFSTPLEPWLTNNPARELQEGTLLVAVCSTRLANNEFDLRNSVFRGNTKIVPGDFAVLLERAVFNNFLGVEITALCNVMSSSGIGWTWDTVWTYDDKAR